VPASSWVSHPGDAAYSYLDLNNVSQGYHKLSSDSGFNAIAYGYAQAESYGYSAGANVKDLYQFVSVQNQYATVSFPAACRNSPFFFSMTFPYEPTQIKWIFNGLFPDVTIDAPVYDSSWVVNGKRLFRYKLTTPYTITTTGTFPIKVVAQNPTGDGCSGEQEINYDLQVFERPVADFNFVATGCVSDSVHFSDNANTNGRPAIMWSWDFADGGASDIKNPAHLYMAAGSYAVKYSVVTDIGCLSDTASKTIIVNDPPVAKFGIALPSCINKAISFSDSSSVPSGTITKWYWNFGDGSPQVIASSAAPQSHTYATTGTFSVTLKVESAGGCQSLVYTKTVTISPNPLASFSFGNACLPGGLMQFTSNSSISDGTQGQFAYQWTFSDGGTSTDANPTHNYSSTGPFTAALLVTSNNGCTDDSVQTITTIYAQPLASFTAAAEVCFGTVVNFSDQTSTPGSSAVQWQWDFGDGNSANSQNPTHNYSVAGTYPVTLTVTSAVGCVSTLATKTVVVNALPAADFNFSVPNCMAKDITLTDASVPVSGVLTKWTWDLGDGTNLVRNTNAPFTHSYATAGTYTITLKVETDKGCVSTVKSKAVTIHVLPVAGFVLPDNCINDPFVQFTDASSISDGTQSQFSYLWDFGDPDANGANPNTSTAANPRHQYTAVGTYNVTMTVTSAAGCTATLMQPFTINGAVPQSAFSINNGNQQCSNTAVSITNSSSVDFGRLVKLEVYWDYSNDPTAKTTVNLPQAGAVYSHSYPEFFSPATKTYQVRVVAYSGDNCLSSSSQTLTLKATPEIVFSAIPGVCSDVAPFQITAADVINGMTGDKIYS
jgi:PKD repeat protein